MEPFSATVGAGISIFDRWSKSRDANLDAKVLVRLLLLEARHNLAILEVAVGRNTLPTPALWEVPEILQTGFLETVLGRGDSASHALSAVRKLRVSTDENAEDDIDFLTSLHVRITALRSLSLLNRRNALPKVQIDRRLKNLRKDQLLLVKALSKEKTR